MRTRWSSLFVHLFVAGSLLSSIHGFDYDKLSMDTMTGILVKPEEWSLRKFTLIKELRMKELLRKKFQGIDADSRLFPEDGGPVKLQNKTRRIKRSVDTSRINEDETAVALQVGLYREETMLIPKLTTNLFTEADTDGTQGSSVNQFWIFVHQELLKVEINPSSGAVVIMNTNDDSLGSISLDLATDATVTDVEIGTDPTTGTSFLAFAVSSPVEWPADISDEDDLDIMNINDPVVLPTNAGSSIYKIEVEDDGNDNILSTTLHFERNVPTIQASDAEFFIEDDNLHLAFAHRGNIMKGVQESESTLLKFVSSSLTFDITQGYQGLDESNEVIETDASLITRNPQRVIFFEIYNRNYLVFVNQHGDKYSINDEHSSYIYKFNESSSTFEIFQKLLTVNAVDAVSVKIQDPDNALNSQWFLIFANKEDSNGDQVDSLVYKFSEGKFAIHQSLSHSDTNKPISVASISRIKEDESHILQHAVVFLMENGKLEFFQFDGFNFIRRDHSNGMDVDAPSLSVNSQSASPVSIEASPLQDDSQSQFVVKYDTGNTRTINLDFMDVVSDISNPQYSSNKDINDYMTSVKDQWTALNIENMYEKYENMPRSSDTDIFLEDVEFQAEFSVGNVDIASKFDEEIDSASLSVTVVDDEGVENVITINSGLLDELKKYDDGDFVNNLSNLVQEVDDLKATIATGATISSSSVLDNEVVFEDLEFGPNSKLVAQYFEVDIDEESEDIYRGRKICAASSDDDVKYDLVEFMKNIIQLDSLVNLVQNQVSFENLIIEKEYLIGQINGDSITNIWQSDKDQEISGTTTFAAASSFNGATSVSGTVGGLQFSKSKILLTSGDQTLDIPFTFSNGDVSIYDITMEKVNNFNLADMDRYITWDDDDLRMNTIDLLEVDRLVLPKLSFDELKALNDEVGFVESSSVNMRDLVKVSMKKEGNPNEVTLKYDFKGDVEVTSASTVSINSLHFDNDFVAINDDFVGTTLNIDNIVAQNGINVKINGAINTVDMEDDILVDVNGDLELLLLGEATHSDDYVHQVDAVKTFATVQFNDHVDTTDNDVHGYDLTEHVGTTTHSQDYSISNLVLTNVESIGKIDLDNGGSINVNDVALDFNTIYTNGVRRSIASWPSTVTTVNFNQVEFVENVNVNSLNNIDGGLTDIDPEADLIPLSGNGVTRTFSAPVVFEDTVTLTNAPSFNDEDQDEVKSCQFGKLERCLCDDGDDCQDSRCELIGDECYVRETCEFGTLERCLCQDCQDANCEEVGDECYVKESCHSGVGTCVCQYCQDPNCEQIGDVCYFKDSPSLDLADLHASTVSHPLKYVDENILKTTGDQTIAPKLVFLAGFEANSLTVSSDDCNHDSIACDNIALKTIDQEFTGSNKINGEVSASVVSVSSELDVGGTVDDVDIDNAYVDTLFIDHTAQTTDGLKTFSKDISVESLTSNGNGIAFGDKTFAFGSDFVLRTEESISIASDVVFNKKVDIEEFDFTSDAVTWDQIPIGSFFDNLLTHGTSQVISGDLTISEDLTIEGGLAKDDSNDAAVTKINYVDIVDIASKALKIDENEALNGVTFDVVEIDDVNGLTLNGEFHGVDLSEEAVTKSQSSSLEIQVDHVFQGSITSEGDLTLVQNIISIVEDSKSINQAELWNFLVNPDSVSKIQVTNNLGATATAEPVIVQINFQPLDRLYTNSWDRMEDVTIPHDVQFTDVDISGTLAATHLNDKSLSDWKDTYLSLSAHQIISADYTFSGSNLEFSGDFQASNVFIGDEDGNEGLLKTLDGQNTVETSHKFLERYFKVLMRNASSTDVVLNPENAHVAGHVQVQDGVKINGVDLSEDVLTYKDGDEKTMTESVTFTGDLVLCEDCGGNLETQTDSNIILVDSEDVEQLSVNLEERYGDVIRHDDATDVEIEITEDVSILPATSFTSLEGTINGVDVGECSDPKILTTNNCGNDGSMILAGSGTFTFNSPESEKSVNMVNLNLDEDANVWTDIEEDGKAWTDVMNSMVSSTATGDVTVISKKQFDQDEFAVKTGIEVDISSTVFGLSSAHVEKTTDMKFSITSLNDDDGPKMPDLTSALDTIVSNSELMPDQYLYMTPIYTHPSPTSQVKSISVFPPNDFTEQDWELLPFHIITLVGDFTTLNQDIVFHQVTLDYPDVENVDITFTDTQPQGTMMQTDHGDAVVFGDVIILMNTQDVPIYVMLLKDNQDLTKLSIYEWDSVNTQLAYKVDYDRDWTDLEFVELDSPCFVGCGLTSSFVCLDENDFSISETEWVEASNCFKASSATTSNGEIFLSMAINEESSQGQVLVYKYSQDDDLFSEVQSVNCYMCSFASLGVYQEELFISLVSTSFSYLYLGKWNNDQDRFLSTQSLIFERPSEAIFYNHGGNLYLSVLADTNSNSKIHKFKYLGLLGFVEQEDRVIKLVGIDNHNILHHPLLSSPLLSSTGLTNTFSSLTSNSLLQTTYKRTDITELRAEAEEMSTHPYLMSKNCLEMVLGYTTKLYHEFGGADNPNLFSIQVLRMMPRPFINFNTDPFSDAIVHAFNSADESLKYSNIPEASVLLYPYDTLDDGSVLWTRTKSSVGSAFIYQDSPRNLFIEARLVDSAYVGDGSRDISFWTSCDQDGTELENSRYWDETDPDFIDETVYKPVETQFGDNVQDICYMVHQFDEDVSGKLANIHGDDSVAAVRIAGSDGNRFACGYMKQTEQNILNFKQFNGFR